MGFPGGADVFFWGGVCFGLGLFSTGRWESCVWSSVGDMRGVSEVTT